MLSLTDRRFLITHTMVHHLMGSTVVALELADHLRRCGAEVVVYAAFVDDPMRSHFEAAGITLDDDGSTLRLSDFDYVWVHSQVLPESLVEQLAELRTDRLPRFIFHHMSSLPYAPDEHPYLWGVEERLSALSLFVAPDTREQLLPFFEHPPETALFANPAPLAWGELDYRAGRSPQRVVVVSNHTVPEVEQALDILRQRGHEVRHVGIGRDQYELVTPEVLQGADVVITIGKTVQYCLVAGIPVFVYDHFGGFGYLSEENFETAMTHNFSGRGGIKCSAETLVDELTEGYAGGASFQAERREELRSSYSIDEVVGRVLRSVDQSRDPLPLDPSMLRALSSAEHFAARAYRHWGFLRNADRDRDAALAREKELLEENSTLRAAFERQLIEKQTELDDVRRSWTFRVGRAIVAPASALVRKLRLRR